jgi:AraC-like DNA-binding protein
VRDLVSTVIWLGVIQGAVLSPVLWKRRANHLANQILAALIAGVALMLLLGEIGARFGFAGHPHLLGLGAPLPFLFSPLLYLYVVSLTRPVTRFDPRWLVHALPFVADALYMTEVFYVKSGEEKILLALLSDGGAAPASLRVMTSLEVLQALVYLVASWRVLGRYGEKMQSYFSDLTRIDLRWLRALVVAHGGIWCVVLAGVVLRGVTRPPRALGDLVHLGSSIVIFLTGYVSLWQTELVPKATAAKVVAPPAKYQRNRLDDDEAKELVAKLEALMTGRKLYREPGLTLSALADELGITPHMLSQVLNVRVGKSFFAYVNAYRAEALKEALASDGDRGVLELALEVGFTSKSTLNSSFKKHTGMTPTEYRARAQSTKNSDISTG